MRPNKRWIAGMALGLLMTSAPVHAESASFSDPLVEVTEASRLLMENHLERPTEAELVKGALKNVSEQLNAQQHAGLSVPPGDDTVAELDARLHQWKDAYRVDGQTIARWAVAGMVASLNDPHTVLFTQEDLNRFQQAVENEGVGFGFRLGLRYGNCVIKQVYPNSPAEEAGLQAGDYLFAVNGVPLKGKSLEDLIDLLKGDEGSEAALSVYKPREKRMVTLNVRRMPMEIPEVQGARFSGDIGYLSVATFGSETGEQFRDELNRLKAGNPPLKGLVIDLRDNGGGYLSSARDVASLLMEEGVLMHTVDRNGLELTTWVRNGRPIGLPVRVLVNEGTASASELLAGALQDHGIAKLVGTRTYGKGSAQEIVPLPGGDALKITLQEYVTPLHRKVNHVGLAPDIRSTDDVSQVIEALASLGVRSFELKENAWGDVSVNGVPVLTAEPLFMREKTGVMVRAAVMASLTGNRGIGTKGYVRLDTFLNRGGRGTVEKGLNGILLRFVKR